jgi:hypothetical protein
MESFDARCAEPSMIATRDVGLRYPRVAAYLSSLPAGMESYPQCRARSSVAENLVRARPPAPSAAAPPPFVAALFGPSLRTWMPEVRLQTTALAIADHTRMSDEQFLAWAHDANAAMYRTATYRAIMSLFSPQILFQGGASRWNVFHEGTRLTFEGDGPGRGSAMLTFPPQLFTELLLRQFAQAFRAALLHSRAKASTVEVDSIGPTSARFVARWS